MTLLVNFSPVLTLMAVTLAPASSVFSSVWYNVPWISPCSSAARGTVMPEPNDRAAIRKPAIAACEGDFRQVAIGSASE